MTYRLAGFVEATLAVNLWAMKQRYSSVVAVAFKRPSFDMNHSKTLVYTPRPLARLALSPAPNHNVNRTRRIISPAKMKLRELRGTTYASDLIVFPVGKYDIMLGALWIKTLGLMIMDFNKLIMSFNYQDQFHLLKRFLKDVSFAVLKL
ncbi:hypothetical protein HAX54_011413 [Datura stramonium]|uniref:Uncharacterized protein n=1 Tax=Datura stramonium TaxID=4076 RepID=A0ABS8THZ1_DATST|nr:hypothetical protein [Datura stramonium]